MSGAATVFREVVVVVLDGIAEIFDGVVQHRRLRVRVSDTAVLFPNQKAWPPALAPAEHFASVPGSGLDGLPLRRERVGERLRARARGQRAHIDAEARKFPQQPERNIRRPLITSGETAPSESGRCPKIFLHRTLPRAGEKTANTELPF